MFKGHPSGIASSLLWDLTPEKAMDTEPGTQMSGIHVLSYQNDQSFWCRELHE